MHKIEFDKISEGTELPPLVLDPITHANLVRYAGASGDFNPIHNDKDFAIANGLDGTIAHGMYIMAMIGRLSTNWVDQRQIHFFGVKFKAMAKLGQTLTCKGVVKRKKDDSDEDEKSSGPTSYSFDYKKWQWHMMIEKLIKELNLTPDKVYEMNYIDCLNWLSMFNDRDKYIKMLEKQDRL